MFVEHVFPYKAQFSHLVNCSKSPTWDVIHAASPIPATPDSMPPSDNPPPIIVPHHTRHVLDAPSVPPASSTPSGMTSDTSHSASPTRTMIHSNPLPLDTSTAQNPIQLSPTDNQPCATTSQTETLVPPPVTPANQPSHVDTAPIEPDAQPIPKPSLIHRPVTRSQNQIYKPKLKSTFLTIASPNTVPHTVTQAKKHKVWRDAMQLEFDALMSNRTWDLVPHDPSKNVVACRWLFRIKRKPDGSIERYKARLVAKGFTQRPGIDYHSTFSPVVKPTTVRIVLSIAVANNWPLRQLDVNNAFLQGNLSEEVYMSQPPGYESSEHPTHVCRLRKAIYGLKQAPLAWYNALTTHLQLIGFMKSKSDPSLFLLTAGNLLVYILVYVDDIIITGNNMAAITRVIHSLASRFSIKDLGPLHFFLGIEVIQSDKGLILSQSGYIEDLLSAESMHEAKPVATPMSTSTVFTMCDGTERFDASRYRTVLGKLQYLSFTRPNISYSVNKLSQFMHDPSVVHWTALKRILRYLRGTSTLGLALTRSNNFKLSMYSDADWAGDVDGRNSTSGHILFLGSNPISWSSKKQQTVARSSTEAEFKAVANSASEVCWVQNLLHELNVRASTPPVIYCDNVGVHYLSTNPTINTRMKHVAVDFHFVRNLIQTGKLHIQHIHASGQLADTLTKPLSKSLFIANLSKLGVASDHKLEGGV